MYLYLIQLITREYIIYIIYIMRIDTYIYIYVYVG